MSNEPILDASSVAPSHVQWPGDAPPAAPAPPLEPLDPNAWAPPPPPGGEPAEELPGAERPQRRWRFVPRSLTGRLVTGVVSLVVVLVLATGTSTYFALRSFLYNRLDQQIQSVAGSVGFLFNGGARAEQAVRGPQDVWAVALSPSAAVLTQPANSAVEPMNLSAGDRRRLVSGDGGPFTIHTADGHTLRVTTRSVTLTNVTTGEVAPAVAVIGLSTDEVRRTLGRLFGLELAIGASAVVLALLATNYGVRFSLRRLYGVTRTAREVAAELSPEGAGLDRRVPVTEPDSEVGQLAESMNTLLSAVETQFAARLAHEEQMRQFLADASHELRTPLTSIRGYAELARMRREQGDGTDTADNLARIESEGTRMSRLVDDLLTLARTDQGSTPRNEIVDLADLLEEAVTGARAAHPSRRIDLDVPAGLNVVGDRDQLLRVVRNLVTNAVVHTREDGPVGVSAVRDGESVILRVSDAGPGLPPDAAAHVFERFWRADKARTRARGGSGLGLAIVSSIVQAHGGSVRFDSDVRTGSTVTVVLPVRTP